MIPITDDGLKELMVRVKDTDAQVVNEMATELLRLRGLVKRLVEDSNELATWITGYDKQGAKQFGVQRILAKHTALMEEIKEVENDK